MSQNASNLMYPAQTLEARMRDIYQILREKEQAVLRVRKELEALRFCLPLLAEGEESAGASPAVPTNHWPAEAEPPAPPKAYQN